MKNIINPILSFCILFNSCSKEEICSWGNSIFVGKSFTLTKVILVSNNEDITTNLFNSTPCAQNKLIFSDSNYSDISKSICGSGGKWSTSSVNGTKFLNLGSKRYEIQTFNCKSVTLK